MQVEGRAGNGKPETWIKRRLWSSGDAGRPGDPTQEPPIGCENRGDSKIHCRQPEDAGYGATRSLGQEASEEERRAGATRIASAGPAEGYEIRGDSNIDRR